MKFITAAASATLFMAFVAVSLLAACDPTGADTSLPKPGIFGPGKSRIWKLDQIGKVHKPGWTIQKQVDTIEVSESRAVISHLAFLFSAFPVLLILVRLG